MPEAEEPKIAPAGADVADEFETIARLFAPLAHPEWGRGLIDDVAVVPTRSGHDLVLTKDAIIQGVHFLDDDPLDLVARKLLRVNLSDLAAKGAAPFGYMLACCWNAHSGWAEREAFAAGLAEDQKTFDIALLGGDTVVTPGPATFSATLLGWAPRGRAVSRVGAQPGDLVVVTGTIGDGGLGLAACRDELDLEPERLAVLASAYRLPEPRVGFAPAILEYASASADVSDGLIADLGHIASASGVGMDVTLERLPLSRPATAWFEQRADPQGALEHLAACGDDYEIVLTVSRPNYEGLKREADRLRLRLTAIGEVSENPGLRVSFFGDPVVLARTGWRHA